MTHSSMPALPVILGDFAALFGLSRPAGQCFAAIWRQAANPCADDLVESLGLSRSNVSTALKELRGWGLISVARVPGDRREFFVAPDDPWEILRLIFAARQRRDFSVLADRLAPLADTDAATRGAHEMVAALSGWLAHLAAMDSVAIRALMTAGESADRESADRAGKKKKKKH